MGVREEQCREGQPPSEPRSPVRAAGTWRSDGPVVMEAFPFAGKRCERLTDAVLKRLGFD